MKIIFKLFKIFVSITAIFLLFFIICIAVIPLEPITQKTIISFLKAENLPEAGITVSKIGLYETRIQDFHLGDKENFHLSSISILYSPDELSGSKINTIILEGLKISLTLKNGNISAGNIDKFLPRFKKGDENKTRNYPLNKIIIKSSEIKFSANGNTIVIPLNAEIDLISGVIKLESRSTGLKAYINNYDINQSKLTASGEFNAHIPVTLKNGKVVLTDGLIESISPGLIKFIPAENNFLFNPADFSTKLTANALRNINYQKLTIKFDTNDNNKINMLMSIAGSNPDLYDNTSLQINLNINADIFGIIADIIGFDNLPEIIRKKLEEKSGEQK